VQILRDARHALLLRVNKQEQRDVTFTAKTIQMSNKSKGHRRATIIPRRYSRLHPLGIWYSKFQVRDDELFSPQSVHGVDCGDATRGQVASEKCSCNDADGNADVRDGVNRADIKQER